MSELSNTLVPLEEEAMDNVMEGDREAAVKYVYGEEYSTSIAKINELKSTFLKTLDERAVEEVDGLIGTSKIILTCLILSLVLIAVMQVLTSYFTRKRIIRPIVKIQNEMGEIANGNLSDEFALEADTSELGRLTEAIHTTKRELKIYISDIDAKLAQMAEGNMDLEIGDDYRGEFLPIQRAMRTILEALNLALSEINEAADQVAAGSEQVATSAQVLASGSTEQASTVQTLSDSIEELGESLKSMASNAIAARDCSESAGRQLEVSNGKMEDLSGSIDKIAEASGQINGIIKMIEDIAFQTNILALNAAVEVRNLAAKSSEAARNTTVLIENMLEQVKQGTVLTNDTTQALLKVVEGAQQSIQLVEEIASVSNGQVEALDHVLNGIREISDVVESNAATAEESAASAEQLSSQAANPKQSASRFRLRG